MLSQHLAFYLKCTYIEVILLIRVSTKMLLYLMLVGFAFAADHDTFKDCSRVEYCNTFRGQAPSNQYVATFHSNTSNSIQLLLNSSWYLQITSLEESTFRIKIQNVEVPRYELEDVLAPGQPHVKNFTNLTTTFDGLLLEAEESRISVNFSPFGIQAFRGDSLAFVFNGDRLGFLDRAFSFGFSFPSASQQYGIHEHADNLALRNTSGTDPYRLRNLDVSGYELNSPMSLYGAVPVLYGHGPNGTAGVFIHNAAEQWFDIDGNRTFVMVESGTLDMFVLLGPSPVEVVRQYVNLTGTAHLPQLWALGYHQCRWNYVSQDDVKDVVANFTTFDFPLDVIWLDIEYTDAKKYFTWDYTSFADPIEMQKNISQAYKRLVTIIDPHIKVEKGYQVYDGALENDYFVKNSDGTTFEGDCWPGLSSYVDFLNPSARTYYASFYSYENFPSTSPVLAGIWNDMNEPSVFDNSLEKTLPGDALHYNGVLHRDIHNIYGLLHTMATHEGLLKRDDSKYRPFVLTRSHFAGTQRYSAIWTGDNTADWGYLKNSYDECLNANILGIVFCGADIGGFDGEPNEELLQRWYQAGAWLPFYRAHANSGTKRREPYLFNEDVQSVIRHAIKSRYHHLPTFYSLFYEHTRNGDPIIRPLWYHHPQDVNVYNLSEHLLLGQDILVRAITQPGVESVPVYFPGGTDQHWFALNSNQIYNGTGFQNVSVDIKAIPVFYRAGSVIFRKDTERLSTDEMIDDDTIANFLLWNGQATGTIYMDDNTSFNYQNNKEYRYMRFDMDIDQILLLPIDSDANSDNFQIRIKQTIINRVVEVPQNGKPGRYSRQILTQDHQGQLFRNIDFRKEKIVKIKFDL